MLLLIMIQSTGLVLCPGDGTADWSVACVVGGLELLSDPSLVVSTPAELHVLRNTRSERQHRVSGHSCCFELLRVLILAWTRCWPDVVQISSSAPTRYIP